LKLKEGHGRIGNTTDQKLLVCFRRLANGVPFSHLEDLARMSGESQRQVFGMFLNAVKNRVGPRYLKREPTLSELEAISDDHAYLGFPGFIGSLDCMNIKWKQCTNAYKGQLQNPNNLKLATISCEAVADLNIYCNHWFVGRAGTKNDLTVIDNSPLFFDILSDCRRIRLPHSFEIDGITRNWLMYYLYDGIYPLYAIFVRQIHAPISDGEKCMTKQQEATRKSFERIFGALQGHFHILSNERHEWSDDMLILISQVCIIIHNILVIPRIRGELDDEIDNEGRFIPREEFMEEFASIVNDGSRNKIEET
jgi:hypothetical protein